MALRAQRGNGQGEYSPYPPAFRQLGNLIVGMDAFHRGEALSRGDVPARQRNELAEIGERARDHDFEARRFRAYSSVSEDSRFFRIRYHG